MGYVPEWYTLLASARQLGVPPWDLLDRPTYWREVALAFATSENKAREQIEKHQQR